MPRLSEEEAERVIERSFTLLGGERTWWTSSEAARVLSKSSKRKLSPEQAKRLLNQGTRLGYFEVDKTRRVPRWATAQAPPSSSAAGLIPAESSGMAHEFEIPRPDRAVHIYGVRNKNSRSIGDHAEQIVAEFLEKPRELLMAKVREGLDPRVLVVRNGTWDLAAYFERNLEKATGKRPSRSLVERCIRIAVRQSIEDLETQREEEFDEENIEEPNRPMYQRNRAAELEIAALESMTGPEVTRTLADYRDKSGAAARVLAAALRGDLNESV